MPPETFMTNVIKKMYDDFGKGSRRLPQLYRSY